MDDHEQFAKVIAYVPRLATFEAASGDLLPLLIGPLYGNWPSVGIRELVQNAIDAVRELRLLQAGEQPGAAGDFDVEVLLDLQKDEQTLTISDTGIGMTADTVCDYFLKIGASFRRSDAWREAFEDPQGHSRVMRSGRFGIGVLASFLLGDVIDVVTRHISAADDDGIAFSASLEAEIIQMTRVPAAVGTTVRIRLRPQVASALVKEEDKWDWYCLREPRVDRRVRDRTGRRRLLKQSRQLPGASEALPREWRRLSHADFEDIHWSHRMPWRLICNGIVIRGQGGFAHEVGIEKGWKCRLQMPGLSVFDPGGRLPLNLQRSGLAAELPFLDDLRQAVIHDFLAFTLINAPNHRSFRQCWHDLKYPGLGDHIVAWILSKDGVLVRDAALIRALNPYSVAVIPTSAVVGSVPIPVEKENGVTS